MGKIFLRASWLLVLIVQPFLSQSQTATPISGIINRYARVTAFDTCDASMTVSDTTGFGKGTRFILFQMNGAAMRESNNSDFGSLDDLRSTGRYEVNVVDSVAGNNLFLRFYVKNEYQTTAALQIVTYPKWANVTVTDTLRAKNWDGLTGGIIAFEATTVTLNAPIIVDRKRAAGRGFRCAVPVGQAQISQGHVRAQYHRRRR